MTPRSKRWLSTFLTHGRGSSTSRTVTGWSPSRSWRVVAHHRETNYSRRRSSLIQRPSSDRWYLSLLKNQSIWEMRLGTMMMSVMSILARSGSLGREETRLVRWCLQGAKCGSRRHLRASDTCSQTLTPKVACSIIAVWARRISQGFTANKSLLGALWLLDRKRKALRCLITRLHRERRRRAIGLRRALRSNRDCLRLPDMMSSKSSQR